MPEQLEFDEDAQNGLGNQNLLINYNISPDRQNLDTRPVNNYGRQLIDFCKSNNFLIANGRLGYDTTGKVTTDDHSVIDYMLATPSLLTKTENFNVHDFDGIFSDKHCRLSWGFRLSTTDGI